MLVINKIDEEIAAPTEKRNATILARVNYTWLWTTIDWLDCNRLAECILDLFFLLLSIIVTISHEYKTRRRYNSSLLYLENAFTTTIRDNN